MKVSPVPFAERNGNEEFNASGVARVGPHRFVFTDNHDPTALFELTLAADGTQAAPVKRRALTGLAPGALDDPEGLTRIDVGGETILIVTSSLARQSKSVGYDGLVRVRYRPDGDLPAEAMPGFRDWMLDQHQELAAAASVDFDKGGLNIEGLTWDPDRAALLFGVRSPVSDGVAPVLCVHLDTAAPWSTAALTKGRSAGIRTNTKAAQGIRAITRDAVGGGFLVLLGRTVSGENAPFELCAWDGVGESVQALDFKFPKSMKPEGVTVYDDDGRRRILVVGDSGCYAVLDAD